VDKARECKKCGYKWWAAAAKKPAKISSWSTINDPTFNAAARTTKAAHERSLKMPAWERYSICSRCGSSKIKQPSGFGFKTTVQEEARAAEASLAAQQAATAAQLAAADASALAMTRLVLQL